MTDSVLVTGATGFVGRAVCPALRARGVRVRAALRRDLRPGDALPGDEHVTVGDIGPLTDWSRALEGIDAVVHLAGLAHVVRGATRAQSAAYRAVNTDATAALARAAAARGVRRLVFASSALVLGGASPGRPWTEDDAPSPRGDYARSKWEAEQRLGEIARSQAIETVILRPPLVYGPGVRANFLALVRLVDRGVPLPIAGIRNRRSLVYLGNLASAIEACLAHPAAAGKTFFVADEQSVSTPELALALAQALGRRARLFSVPGAVLGAFASLAGQRERWRSVSESLELDTTRIRTLLGWRAPHGFQEGVAQTCRWFAAARG